MDYMLDYILLTIIGIVTFILIMKSDYDENAYYKFFKNIEKDEE